MFNTPSARIELYQEQFADLGEATLGYLEPIESNRTHNADQFPFQLITYKHVHSAHGTHVILPLIREVLPGPQLQISPVDAERLGISENDRVEVYNKRGSFQVHATVINSVRPGVLAMTQGWWKKHLLAGHHASLGHVPQNAVQNRINESNVPLWDIHCNVRKAE